MISNTLDSEKFQDKVKSVLMNKVSKINKWSNQWNIVNPRIKEIFTDDAK